MDIPELRRLASANGISLVGARTAGEILQRIVSKPVFDSLTYEEAQVIIGYLAYQHLSHLRDQNADIYLEIVEDLKRLPEVAKFFGDLNFRHFYSFKDIIVYLSPDDNFEDIVRQIRIS